jgi:hypothetical protein
MPFDSALLYAMNGIATHETMTHAKNKFASSGERQDKASKVKQLMATDTGAEKEEHL